MATAPPPAVKPPRVLRKPAWFAAAEAPSASL
jgi:hypothetical protein